MTEKLAKPYPTFPLTPHVKGYWVRVYQGKQHRFGPRWCPPDVALKEWQRVHSSLLAGIEPQVEPTGLTLREGLKSFLSSRMTSLKEGNIVQRSYDDYYRECELVRDALGASTLLESIGPTHFTHLRESMKGTPNVISNRIGRVKVLFKFLYQEGLLAQPVRYGGNFKKPPRKRIREHRETKPQQLFSPEQIHLLLKHAKPQLKGMIWLGLFAGFGNHDCGTLAPKHLCLETGWVTYPRPKTAIKRRAWLPVEAVKALRALAPTTSHVFITRRGNPWATEKKSSPISVEFRKLAEPLGIKLGFYALRHTTETIGGRSKDQIAVDYLMGHVSPGMSSAYREEIEDSRLKAVGDVIRAWLR